MPNHRLISSIHCYRLFIAQIVIVFPGYVHVFWLKGPRSKNIQNWLNQCMRQLEQFRYQFWHINSLIGQTRYYQDNDILRSKMVDIVHIQCWQGWQCASEQQWWARVPLHDMSTALFNLLHIEQLAFLAQVAVQPRRRLERRTRVFLHNHHQPQSAPDSQRKHTDARLNCSLCRRGWR